MVDAKAERIALGADKLAVVPKVLFQILHKRGLVHHRLFARVLQHIEHADGLLKQQVDRFAIVFVVDLVVGESLLLVGLLIVADRVPVEGTLQLLVGRVHEQLLEAVLFKVFEAEQVQQANAERHLFLI